MIEPETNQLNDQYRMVNPVNILRACGSLVQSFSNPDSFDESCSIVNLLEQDHLEQLFPDQNVSYTYRSTYIRLSHYTVKVSTAIHRSSGRLY